MCKNCHIITLLFNEAQKDPHKNYISVLNFLSDLESKDKIELFAGDCQLQEALDVFYSERHYTVCHYLYAVWSNVLPGSLHSRDSHLQPDR